ncbi:MAG TPA: response regulator transcription factor [Bauldia sp.]|nr:response regulator transcription factor [Bauldia sp.]
MRVLLVEDEPRVAADIAAALQRSGYAVDRVDDGERAWFNGDVENYDAAILDIGLPKIDGLSILKRWRANGRAFPVIVLTARGTWAERVEGIDAGADDYLPKPFKMEELLARLRAVLRRGAGQSAPVLTSGPLTLDTRQMTVKLDGRPVILTPLEYRLVSYLMHHADRVVPASELAEHLYDLEHDRDTNAIEVIVARLRRKLGAGVIETRRGFGYLMPSRTQ